MCEYCDGKKDLIRKEANNINLLYWGIGNVLRKEQLENCEYNETIFIDRGYIRLVDEDDCGCIDHGEKIKINYCPICGEKVGEQ